MESCVVLLDAFWLSFLGMVKGKWRFAANEGGLQLNGMVPLAEAVFYDQQFFCWTVMLSALSLLCKFYLSFSLAVSLSSFNVAHLPEGPLSLDANQRLGSATSTSFFGHW